MVQANDSTQARKFQHLDEIKRGKIEGLLKIGMSFRKIAKEAGVNVSTVSREIKRGTVRQLDTELRERQECFAEAGQANYKKNRRNSGTKLKLVEAEEFITEVEKRMKENKWSPDTAIGWLKRQQEWREKPTICTKTMYNYIDKGLSNVKNIDLLLKVKLRQKALKIRKHKRLQGKSIEERPAEIETREEFGNWEIDCVIGIKEKSSVLLTLTERKTRAEIIRKMPSKEMTSVEEALRSIVEATGELWPMIFKTITTDNGTEFSQLTEQLQAICK